MIVTAAAIIMVAAFSGFVAGALLVPSLGQGHRNAAQMTIAIAIRTGIQASRITFQAFRSPGRAWVSGVYGSTGDAGWCGLTSSPSRT
jgi:hypothetical protein